METEELPGMALLDLLGQGDTYRAQMAAAQATDAALLEELDEDLALLFKPGVNWQALHAVQSLRHQKRIVEQLNYLIEHGLPG